MIEKPKSPVDEKEEEAINTNTSGLQSLPEVFCMENDQ